MATESNKDPKRNRVLIALDWHGTIDGIFFGGDDFVTDYFNDFDGMIQKPGFMFAINNIEKHHNAQVDFCIITGGSYSETSAISVAHGMRNLRDCFEKWGMVDKFKYLMTRSNRFLFRVNCSEEAARQKRSANLVMFEERTSEAILKSKGLIGGLYDDMDKRLGIENIFDYIPSQRELDEWFKDPVKHAYTISRHFGSEKYLQSMLSGEISPELLAYIKDEIGTQEDYKLCIVGGNDKLQDYSMIDADLVREDESRVPIAFVSNRDLHNKLKGLDEDHRSRVFTNSSKNHVGIGYAISAVSNSKLASEALDPKPEEIQDNVSSEASELFDKYYVGNKHTDSADPTDN